MNSNINSVKLIYESDNIKIGENAYIKISLCEKRINRFYDVVLCLKDKEIFLGRFDKDDNCVGAKYKDGKILIYKDEFKKQTGKLEIIEVLSLYEVADDTFYSVTEKEAIELFDNTINSTFIKKKNNVLHKTDIEKIKRLQK